MYTQKEKRKKSPKKKKKKEETTKKEKTFFLWFKIERVALANKAIPLSFQNDDRIHTQDRRYGENV
jgi:hypothetical protein